jgi:DNA-binding beta-propeller fold protein YncE
MFLSSAAPFSNEVISPDSNTAYLSVPSLNEVAVLNLATGTFGTPIDVGSDPTSLDITPERDRLLRRLVRPLPPA